MKKSLLRLAFVALPMFGFGQTYFSDNFDDEDISDWTLYDQDGDGFEWETVALTEPAGITPAIASYSYDNASFTALTPDNYIVSPAINLSTATSAVLKFKVKAQDPDWANETYSVYVATTNSVAAFLATTPLLTENASTNGVGGIFYSKSIDLSSFAGQSQVYVAFRHHSSTDMFALHIDDVSVSAAPTVAPGCATLVSPANGATNLNYVSQTFSWSAPATGTVDSYDIYLDKNPNPTTLVSNVTGTTYTAANLDGSSTYYWKAVPKNTIGSATGCTTFSFTTIETTYCGPLTYSFTVEPITLVNFAGIDNTTSASTSGGTAHEFFLDQVGNVTLGSTHTITIKGNTGGNWANNFMVYIDWNQDKDFADADEAYSVGSITNSTGTDTKELTYNITVPAGATIGNTRMRVKKLFGTTNLADPCVGGSFGQAEDYTINVGTLAVSETTKNSIRSYPNPVKDIFNIEAQGKIKNVKVYDTAGKQLFTKELNEAKSQIDFSRFNTGVYVVTTTLEDGTSTSTKVIKK